MRRLLFSIMVFLTINVYGQKYYTKNGNISFFSKASIENILAENNQVLCIMDAKNGNLRFSLLVKNFRFKKALMEEHFNENYMESDKFPKATFKGDIANINSVNFNKDGIYKVNVSGDLSMHGIGKKIESTAIITVTGGKITASSKFLIKVAEFNIKIPRLVKDNISETVEITVNCMFDQKM